MQEKLQRLQKVLAAAGLGSRRQCEEIITQKRVTVDGKIAELGTKVDPERQVVCCDSEPVRMDKKVWYLFYKPKGILCTNSKWEGPTVWEYFPQISQRLFTVGRLDKDSEGLLLVTNDGEFAQKLCHPSFQVSRVYHARLRGKIDEEQLEKLRKGIWLSDGKMVPHKVIALRVGNNESLVELTLKEGHNREIRRMFAVIGHKVNRLTRMRFGGFFLGDIKPGEYVNIREEAVKEAFENEEAAEKAYQKSVIHELAVAGNLREAQQFRKSDDYRNDRKTGDFKKSAPRDGDSRSDRKTGDFKKFAPRDGDSRSDRKTGDFKKFAPRDGDSRNDRKTGDFKKFAPRDGDSRNDRKTGDFKKFAPRDGDSRNDRKTGDFKKFAPKDGDSRNDRKTGDFKKFAPRDGDSRNDRKTGDFKKFAPRDGNFRDKKPGGFKKFAPKDGDSRSDRKGDFKDKTTGEFKKFAPRDGDSRNDRKTGEFKKFAPKDGDFRDKKPGGFKKFAPKDGDFRDKKPGGFKKFAPKDGDSRSDKKSGGFKKFPPKPFRKSSRDNRKP